MPFCHKGDSCRSGDVSDWNVCHIIHVHTTYVVVGGWKLKSFTEVRHGGDATPQPSPEETELRGSGIRDQPWQHRQFEGRMG